VWFSVVADGSGFKLKINKITESVAHLHYDVFQVPDAPFDPFAEAEGLFFSDPDGEISTLALPLETNVKDIVFTRLPDKQLTREASLKPSLARTRFPEVQHR